MQTAELDQRWYKIPEVSLDLEQPKDNLKIEKFIVGSILDKDILNKINDEYEISSIYHLAAILSTKAEKDPKLANDVNINGTQILLEAMTGSFVKKFIFASSSSVYGNNNKTPFSEDDNVDFQISQYGATKKMGEVMCYTYHHLSGIPISCMRFFTVYGPRQRPEMAIHKFTRLLKKGQAIPFFGDGSTSRDYTYIDDIIDGIM